MRVHGQTLEARLPGIGNAAQKPRWTSSKNWIEPPTQSVKPPIGGLPARTARDGFCFGDFLLRSSTRNKNPQSPFGEWPTAADDRSIGRRASNNTTRTLRPFWILMSLPMSCRVLIDLNLELKSKSPPSSFTRQHVPLYWPRIPFFKPALGGLGPSQTEKSMSAKAGPAMVSFSVPPIATAVPVPGM